MPENHLISAKEQHPDTQADMLDGLLFRIAQGEQDALDELYRATRTQVYGFALSILKNSHDAEDALHDCFVSIWNAAPSYRSSGKPLAWILTVTRNLCLMQLRTRKRTEQLPEEDWELPPQLQTEISADQGILLTQCMNILSAEERQILMLHAVSGFLHREIASMLSLPLPTVLSKYHRALKKLRKKLTEGGMNT